MLGRKSAGLHCQCSCPPCTQAAFQVFFMYGSYTAGIGSVDEEGFLGVGVGVGVGVTELSSQIAAWRAFSSFRRSSCLNR